MATEKMADTLRIFQIVSILAACSPPPVLVNLALIDGENANRHDNGCLPPGELHSPGHCIHSMDHGHKEWMGLAPDCRFFLKEKHTAFLFFVVVVWRGLGLVS